MGALNNVYVCVCVRTIVLFTLIPCWDVRWLMFRLFVSWLFVFREVWEIYRHKKEQISCRKRPYWQDSLQKRPDRKLNTLLKRGLEVSQFHMNIYQGSRYTGRCQTTTPETSKLPLEMTPKIPVKGLLNMSQVLRSCRGSRYIGRVELPPPRSQNYPWQCPPKLLLWMPCGVLRLLGKRPITTVCIRIYQYLSWLFWNG